MLTLSRVPLNVAYPFNALGYLAILTASVLVLHEKANVWTVLGSAMVVCGLIVVVTLSSTHLTSMFTGLHRRMAGGLD